MPKPQPCGQNWLAMSPTEKGRLCGQCAKEIHDFSALSWPEIERQQQAHGNTLCGMYAPAQLTYWGQDPPTPAQGACARLAAATTLALTLSALPAPAQTAVAKDSGQAVILRGTVYDVTKEGKSTPLAGVTVLLRGTTLGVSSSQNGHYELSIPYSVEAASAIVFSMVGYRTTELALTPMDSGLQTHDVQLTFDDRNIEVFSVRMPTRMQRAKWTLKRWFSRNKTADS
ncbi:carboxypeptidase-like regulatory domain-containing protein [uncultured Hymenobacter sp.]|uniref:carboxypeptidase-like regulatory domain-containing protein n=1 Tax=uncultured Hymenobacter sp. TaxID=170016 RepID=UPI0035C9685D